MPLRPSFTACLFVAAFAAPAVSAAQVPVAARIWQVFAGSATDPEADFVEIRLTQAGQDIDLFSGLAVYVYDARNEIVGTGAVAFAPSNRQHGASLLFAAPTPFRSYFNVAEDHTLDVPIPAAGGKVCIADYNTGYEVLVDCVAWGNFQGTIGVGNKFQPFTGLRPGDAMRRRDLMIDTGDSAADFSLVPASPRNNGGGVGAPRVRTCGDGHVNALEECDDGNDVDTDGCRNNCRLPYCGDGVLSAHELCEPPGTAFCDEYCHPIVPDPVCGDGYQTEDEECDDGNNDDDDGCSSVCTIERCGDGTTQESRGEQCDDGNTEDDDGCSSECKLEGCGNGEVDDGEECDDGNTESGDGCSAECKREEPCGNGRLDDGEECDDGNTVSGDGCSAQCRREFCGDGVIQTGLGEECDDGNRVDNDACSNECVEQICGNGRVEHGSGEQCDDGNTRNGDGCSAHCRREYCGDGIVQAGLGEECDDRNELNDDGCSADCLEEVCGDGIVQVGLGEECDDGNKRDGDGCSSKCIEEYCGDGIVQTRLGEECDDGNTRDGDQCSSSCRRGVTGGGGVARPCGCANGADPAGLLGLLGLFLTRVQRRRGREGGTANARG